jgi:hypothetical protein
MMRGGWVSVFWADRTIFVINDYASLIRKYERNIALYPMRRVCSLKESKVPEATMSNHDKKTVPNQVIETMRRPR